MTYNDAYAFIKGIIDERDGKTERVNMIPAGLWPHITIEEINSLTEDEACVLLYICNVLFPIRPPMPTEDNPHPITLNLIRAAQRDHIIGRIKQAEPSIKEEGKEIYNGLKTKLNVQ